MIESKINKVRQSWMRWKMPLCKWHTFWIAPCLTCYFQVILFYVERKCLLMRNLVTVLSLKSKLSGKFQRFNTIEEGLKCWQIVEFQKISIKWKIVKHFTRPKQRAALRKLFSLPQPPTHLPSDKILLHLWNKNFLTEIYGNVRESALKVLQECKFWSSINGGTQMFCLTPNRNMFAGTFVKSERFLDVLREHIISMSSELRFIKKRGFSSETMY